jgi:16S rRNA processing protein RimM
VQLVVGRIAKAHGVGGEVSVDVRTDDPDGRFTIGATLDTEPAENGPLTVERARWHSGRLLVSFGSVTDRTAAEQLRGTMLVVDSATSGLTGDVDDFWDHDLIGLAAVIVDGPAIGEVIDVLHPPGTAVLVVRRETGDEALIPFVREIVPAVDLAARRVLVDPPEGLLEL